MGTTVGAIVISYDVNRRHPEVKDALLNLGYFDNWKYTGQANHLMPNTTLWHSSKTSDQGLLDMRRVCQQLGVTLEKAVSVLANEFVGI